MKKILVVGATGLVGSSFVKQAAMHGDFDLHTLTRRKSGEGNHIQHVHDSEDWPDAINSIKPGAVFCALGTTIKQAGSRAAFRAVDLELVQAVAQAAKAAGTRHFISISSTMADANASSFYLKAKGEAENALKDCGFDRLDIIRPGLLKGDRQGAFRLGESLAIVASPFTDILLQGSLKKYRSVDADDVADAALKLFHMSKNGDFCHENPNIWALAAK